MAMKIYLAGPEVFLPFPIARGAELKASCAAAGAIGLFPMDNEHAEGLSGAELAYDIRTANMGLIRACDAVVANMDPFRGPSMDVGTAYELGVAAALGKIVVGYTGVRKSYLEKVSDLFDIKKGEDGRLRDKDGMAVEDFKGEGGVGETSGLVDNLMMACGVEKLCESVEEAIAVAVEIFNAKREGRYQSKVVG